MMITINQKMSGTGSIHDLSSDQYERRIDMRADYCYAVVLPAYYGDHCTRHRTIGAALSEFGKQRRAGFDPSLLCRSGKSLHVNYWGDLDTNLLS
ncbi:hypothetical protein LCGC14_1805840 [marine sediment metagenome]|uniref:Uncharacterized protein n=1 Tax=marine sediment metagenome TaxID=412755 RepID=A0A0F9GNE1_9ZZZZ